MRVTFSPYTKPYFGSYLLFRSLVLSLIHVEILIYGLIHFTSFHTVRGSRSSL
jgi:hypothetical protein